MMWKKELSPMRKSKKNSKNEKIFMMPKGKKSTKKIERS